jgi:TRAP-type mannitol/chloroaromatic compound transport system permease large subunit
MVGLSRRHLEEEVVAIDNLPATVAPQWRLGDIYWGMAQFMVLQIVGLALCIMFPQIALWFPRLALREVAHAALA